jgi:hypothetical protein
MVKHTKQEWTALCRDCRWTGKRQSDQTDAKQEVKNHIKTHPGHQVRVFVTGEKEIALPSALSFDRGNYPNLPVKGNT